MLKMLIALMVGVIIGMTAMGALIIKNLGKDFITGEKDKDKL